MNTRMNVLTKRLTRLDKKLTTSHEKSLDELLTPEQLERIEYARKMSEQRSNVVLEPGEKK